MASFSLIVAGCLVLLFGIAVLNADKVMSNTRAIWSEESRQLHFDVQNNQIFIPVKIGGADHVALLDNGVELMALDESLAKSMGLRHAGRVRVNGGVTPTVNYMEFRVGPLSLRPFRSMVAGISGITRASSREVGAIVGRPLFEKAVVLLEFEKNLLHIEKPGEFQPRQSMTAFALRTVKGRMIVDLIVNGAPECAVVDLGFNGAMMVHPDYFVSKDLGVVDENSASKPSTSTATVEGVVRIGEVELMGAKYSSIPAVKVSGQDYSGCKFFVGMELLRRYDLAFDLKRGRLFADPTRSATAPFQ